MSFLTSNVRQLRLIGLLEGVSLLLLIGVAVPLKHLYGNPALVRTLGPIHGLLFLLFIVKTLSVGVEQRWKFSKTTWKVLLACMVPFGTFYIDYKILRKLPDETAG
jgi:integral membrane protein